MNVVGRAITAQLTRSALRISSGVGGSGWPVVEAGGTELEASGAAHGGESIGRCVDDPRHETRCVIGETALAEDLQRRDADDLVNGHERVLEDGDLPRLDAFGAADTDLPDEGVP